MVLAQDIAGQWNGVFEMQGVRLRLVFNIDKEGDAYKATMDSPDQGAKGVPVTSVRFVKPSLKIEINNIEFSYVGTQKNDTLIEGSFAQGAMSFPLNLVKKKMEMRRPQEPKPPFDYKSEDVKIQNEKAGITLAGTLTYPESGSKYPAVVLISGSGPQNRDEEVMGHKPFAVLADYLTSQGIAVLRYDDRGVGQSQGDFALGTTADFASDALAAFAYLRTRTEINHKKVGLLGHSEGGTITFMVAAGNKDIAFIVSLAGKAMRGATLLYE